ncbi:MAG: PKD domain-containing protein, partial [Bacteroidetes bacterium]
DISAGLETDLVQTQFFVLPDTTPWGAFFPGANLALGFPGVGYNYLSINSMEALSLGFAGSDPTGNLDQEFVIPFEDPQTVAVFPAQMGVSFVDTSVFSLTIEGAPFNLDSIVFRSTQIDSVEYDGWGTLTTPNGTYNALRSHTNTTQLDTVWGYFFGTAFLLDTTKTHTQSWQWLSPQTKGPVATATLDEDGNWTVSWSLLSPPPVAQFTYQDMGNGLFQFTDQSGNNPDSWLWDFGDGNTSTEQNPMHTYAAPGTYTVCLTVGNSAGTDTTCMDVTVVFPPEAAFTYTDEGNGTIAFADASANGPDSWLWDFGDGATSTEQNPTHTYTAPGDYTVCLIASNSAGSDTACMNITVVLPPVAAFSITDQGNGTFAFTDLSTNDPESWLWDFGDGNTSTEQNPTHTYTSSGDYTVCLTVSNSAGTDTACQTISVTVTGLIEAWSHLSLALYPNPVFSELHVQIDWTEPLQWELYDALGRKVRARTFVQTATVQVTDLP